ncbi:MAG: M20/M25/M40 family metallo-hydrolase [Bacteroidales bacterium]|nr:M20/M25/M40 family metallo-hydrolase [Bacteroidales bacterium]
MRLLPTITLVSALLFNAPGFIAAQDNEVLFLKALNAINVDVLKAQTGFLASDWMEGRRTGEKGEFMAADYIASMLQLYGVKPYGDLQMTGSVASQGYFQNFTILKTSPVGDQSLRIIERKGDGEKITECVPYTDFIINRQLQNVVIEAPVVFVGYGFRNSRLKYDDLRSADLQGKIILKLSGIPDIARTSLTASEISASVAESEAFLKEAGALAVMEFDPGRLIAASVAAPDFMQMSPAELRPVPQGTSAYWSLPAAGSSAEPVRIRVSSRVASVLLAGTGVDIDEYRRLAAVNKAKPATAGYGISVRLGSAVTTTQIASRNILGIIEGEKRNEIIVIGAHYDHMGISDGYIWNGADDNASGSVGVLTLAKALMECGKKPAKTIVFAFWSGEEQGLLGSRHFVRNLPFPASNIRLNLNYDMISRYISPEETKRVTMTYTDSFPWFRELTQDNLIKYDIDLDIDYQPSSDPPGGTDHRSFVAVGIPVMRFKPGHREEYHTPSDETETLDWDIMEKIIKISFANIRILSEKDW